MSGGSAPGAGTASPPTGEPPPRYPLSWISFGVVIAFALVWVSTTVPQLPEHVATHFDAFGDPDSSMSRGDYLMFMLPFSVGLPLLVVAVMSVVFRRARRFNLPHRDYWLAPQRIAHTRAFLVAHAVWFGSILTGFLCYVHQLIIDANSVSPPHLSNAAALRGLTAMFIALAVWIVTLVVRFRRVRD